MTKWIRRKLRHRWEWFVHEIGMGLEARGYLGKTGYDKDLEESDNERVLTALVFALEVLERSPHPDVRRRVSLHLEAVAMARLHRHGKDCIRELPPKTKRKRARAAV